MPSSAARPALAALTALALTALAACGSSGDDAGSSPRTSNVAAAGGAASVQVGAVSNGAATPVTLTVPEVAAIRAELPKALVDKGKIVIGLGLLPSGSPPLGYTGSDQKTLTGSEPDLGRLVAAVFGLTPVLTNATWENLFVGLDSGKTDVGITNITDTEQRKLKYDFATYRQDNLGFEVLKSNSWTFDGTAESLAGKTVVVGAGTNQEKILLEWQAKLKAAGKKLTVKYFPDQGTTYLALSSGKADAYFAPNPSIAYHVTQSQSSSHPTRNAGTYSGAGASLQGLIAATSKKGSGLAKPLADAINYLIDNGQYAAWLKAWNLSNEAVKTSEVNPPGLPITNS
ncbi:polar amino acid transport system substrate-binding protein [Motilibacter peucedani]|uniref:Polar amino acid transport system substrate-binding protein n=1 Tax=Motilibacter peucedani TaxID=598650 RepID=A0A420XKV2_9ACTN|nr:ABC transporter substrate-binding protein [Motilibacter peucedani]RKS68457.1 polar amino acid transport system substrate-binding protein [Motilibacter peucedani]